MKTIKELNSAWWYRMLKVIFILFFILIATIGTFLIFLDTPKKVDLNKSMVNCENGVKTKVLTAAGDDYTLYDLYAVQNNNTNNELTYKLRRFCMSSVVEMKDGTKKLMSYNDVLVLSNLSAVEKINGEPLNYEKAEPRIPLSFFFSPNKNNFTLEIATENELYKHLVIFFAALVGFFELFKRSFYYIALASIKPE